MNWPFLLQNLVTLLPAISPTNSRILNFQDNSLRLVPQNASCELFVGQVLAISPFVGKLFIELVASPLVCADLNSQSMVYFQ